MWDGVEHGGSEYDRANVRDRELATTEEYWRSMAKSGSCQKRWMGSAESAGSILQSLISVSDSQGPVVLRMQRELVEEGLDLDGTAGRIELAKHHGESWQRMQRELKALRGAYQPAVTVHNRCAADRLERAKAGSDTQVEEAATLFSILYDL